MQIYADVTGRPFRLSGSDQTPALGSAMFGAVAAGPDGRRLHLDRGREPGDGPPQGPGLRARPAANRAIYDVLYREYVRLHDYFGRGENDVMKTLRGPARHGQGRASA